MSCPTASRTSLLFLYSSNCRSKFLTWPISIASLLSLSSGDSSLVEAVNLSPHADQFRHLFQFLMDCPNGLIVKAKHYIPIVSCIDEIQGKNPRKEERDEVVPYPSVGQRQCYESNDVCNLGGCSNEEETLKSIGQSLNDPPEPAMHG